MMTEQQAMRIGTTLDLIRRTLEGEGENNALAEIIGALLAINRELALLRKSIDIGVGVLRTKR